MPSSRSASEIASAANMQRAGITPLGMMYLNPATGVPTLWDGAVLSELVVIGVDGTPINLSVSALNALRVTLVPDTTFVSWDANPGRSASGWSGGW